jgi:hypothetical protein
VSNEVKRACATPTTCHVKDPPMSDTDPPLETLSRDAVTLLTKVILEVVAVLSTEAMTTFGHASKETTPVV